MKRIVRNLELVVALIFIVALTVACPKKEAPGPAPEPTVVAEPTAIVPDATPTCIVKVPQGTPGGDICKDAAGERVTCPAETTGLPACGD